MPTYDTCLVEAELRARSDYAAPLRFYHDERHLDECLAQLDRVEGLSQRDRQLLRWAILWHDAVYEPERDDNEERSAERAERELRACGVSDDDAAEVARLIRLTNGHRAADGDRLGALLISIDLSILGSDADRYDQYASEVRREYAHLSDEVWRGGRAALLEHLLAPNALFPDAQFHARLEARARRNIQAELRSLRAG